MSPKKTEIDKAEIKAPDKLPVLPLRDLVVFPHMVVPLVIGREGTLAAVDDGMLNGRMILLVAQKNPSDEDPTASGMFRVGVLGRIVQMVKLPNGLAKVLVEGLIRAKVNRYIKHANYLQAKYTIISGDDESSSRIEAAHRHLSTLFKEFITLNRQIPDEITMTIDQISNSRHLADFVAIHLGHDLQKKQKVLESSNIYKLLVQLSSELQHEIEILTIEQNIEGQVKENITKSQRAYYLQEQIRTIKKELGEDPDEDISDVIEFRRKIKKAKMSKEAFKKAGEELKRLINTPMMSPEATVIRSYLDWLIDVPWHKATKDNTDISKASSILDEDHYGLEKPKERILEHLAVLALAGKMRGPILCLVGPPGVGKTSLGKSVARALNREFVRVSLGGVRDEAEIRGHRRTYIGALPGRIVQSMKKAGSVNPVFLLDEIDKMSTDFRGDPSSAMLEVLDSDQNHTFSDHYLEVDYDLSQVLFITTANYQEAIPWALQDRMEIIRLPGYLHQEKFEIARRFLIPKQMDFNGLKAGDVDLSKAAVNTIIERYTREAGVRDLERQIAKVFRKSAREIMETPKLKKPLKIGVKKVLAMLGVEPHDRQIVDGKDRIGAAVGLAWTATGGELLMIETESLTGKGTLTLTGSLGDVMQESARAALTSVRSRAEMIGFDDADFLKKEIHIHFPEGAVSKDGPSAGITIAVALASNFSRRPVRGDIAMTGEITLRGEVLPIGGLREKLMAAVRANVKTVIIPARNQRELSEVPEDVLKPLEIIPVKTIDNVFDVMLLPADSKTKSSVPAKKTRKVTAKK
ncbi:MAG: endopeptidase La [Calditrichaeota bacterium]|nr:endopeptidase La [Calditrichota bacterium]